MGAQVARSTDDGKTWESSVLPGISRAFELFSLDSELYAVGYRPQAQVYRYSGGDFHRVHIDLFPDALHSANPMIVRSVLFNDVLLYIGADNVNDHQWTSFAAYKARRIDEAKKLNLPPHVLPYDMLVREGYAYILTNRFEDGAFSGAVVIYRS